MDLKHFFDLPLQYNFTTISKTSNSEYANFSGTLDYFQISCIFCILHRRHFLIPGVLNCWFSPSSSFSSFSFFSSYFSFSFFSEIFGRKIYRVEKPPYKFLTIWSRLTVVEGSSIIKCLNASFWNTAIHFILFFSSRLQNVGKGSLWMVDAHFRPNLLHALEKAPYSFSRALKSAQDDPSSR